MRNCNQGMMPNMPIPTPFYNYTESMMNSNNIDNLENRLATLESRVTRIEQTLMNEPKSYTNNNYNDSTYYQA